MAKRLRKEGKPEAVFADGQVWFLPLPVEPTREIRFELDADWDGRWKIDPELVRGARIKPVVFVPEERASEVDKASLRQLFLDTGATYCKLPEVHVHRKEVRRDARHDVELSIEESLWLFASETRPKNTEDKVLFAAALAREADAGAKE